MASLNGYELESDWTNVARGAFAYGRKGGKRFFIKKLPSPTYPDNPALFPPGSDTTRRCKEQCDRFEKNFNAKVAALKKARGLCDLLVQPVDFFRVKSKYYIVSDAIEGSPLEPERVCKLSPSERYSIMKDFAESLAALESVNIIHGDIKPSNVLIIKRDGKYRPLLIDFDDCYFSGHPPENADATVGSPEFYSPELGSYISKKDPSRGGMVTCSSDIFAAAILFFQYQTGEALRPKKTDGHVYPFQVFADDMEFCGADESFVSLMRAMLEVKAEDRPKAKDVPGLISIVEKGGRVTSKTSDMILLRRDDRKLFIIKGGKKMSATRSSAVEYSKKYGMEIVDEGGEKVTDDELDAIFGKGGTTGGDSGSGSGGSSGGGSTGGGSADCGDHVLVKGGKYYIVIGGTKKSAPKGYALDYAKEHGLDVIYGDADGGSGTGKTEGDSGSSKHGGTIPPSPPEKSPGDHILIKDGKFYIIKSGKKMSATKGVAISYAKDNGLKFLDESGKEVKMDRGECDEENRCKGHTGG